MPKIKLKSNLHGVEIGIGTVVNLKVAPGETVEVAEELLAELLGFGHFEIAKEEKITQKTADPGGETETDQ